MTQNWQTFASELFLYQEIAHQIGCDDNWVDSKSVDKVFSLLLIPLPNTKFIDVSLQAYSIRSFSIVHRYELLVPAGTKEKQSKSLGDLLDMVSFVLKTTNFDVNMNTGHHLCVHRLTMCISSIFRNKQTMWTEMAAAAVATVVVQVHQVPRLKRHLP